MGFIDNNEFLTTRREMLMTDLENINRQIASLEKQKGKEEQLFKVQTVIEAFDSDIKKISVDAIATQKIPELSCIKLCFLLRWLTLS